MNLKTSTHYRAFLSRSTTWRRPMEKAVAPSALSVLPITCHSQACFSTCSKHVLPRVANGTWKLPRSPAPLPLFTIIYYSSRSGQRLALGRDNWTTREVRDSRNESMICSLLARTRGNRLGNGNGGLTFRNYEPIQARCTVYFSRFRSTVRHRRLLRSLETRLVIPAR